MNLTFAQPLWLLLILLAIPVAIIGVRWLQTMSRLRMWSAVVARSILIALIACILAGAASVRTSDRLAVIAVVDVSDSVRQFAEFQGNRPEQQLSYSSAVRQWIEQAIRERATDDLFGLVVFDGRSLAIATPTSIDTFDFSLDYHSAQGTNIEEALEFAEALFPPGAARRLVLISDGVETSGDAMQAARRLAAGGATAGEAIPVDVLPISYEVRREVMVESVDAPPRATAGSTVPVRIVFNSTQDVTGRLEVLYEGRPLDLNGALRGTGQRVSLRKGRGIAIIQAPLDADAKVHRFEPVFIPDDEGADQIATNNRAEAFTITPGKGEVLLLNGAAIDEGPAAEVLARTLANAGINVESLPPEMAPNDLLRLQSYDLVILQNVASDMIPRPTQAYLADYVTDLGGGLVMIGGPDSFGAGLWKGTPVEPILPVRLDLPEQLITPSAAVMFVLDSSGSMRQTVLGGSRTQQEIANEAAALAIETLDPTDLVGVIAFNSGYTEVVDLNRNRNPAQAADRVRAIAANGGTNLYPALAHAAQVMKSAEANVKHIIVLSDGQSEGNPEHGRQIAADLLRNGITVSAIAVGDGADRTTLAGIAMDGGGQFYEVFDPNVLPRIFIKDIRVVRKPLIRLTPFDPVVADSGSPLLRGIPLPLPTLYGLVLTQPRDDPKITNALLSPEGEPLLAHWFVERGQVAAFTSDAHRWARDWIGWEGYSQVWVQLVRQISRPSDDRRYELTTEIVSGEMRIQLEAADDLGRPMDLLTIPGHVYLPEGGPADKLDIRLEQVGPGSYAARIPAPQQGNYIVTLMPRRGEQPLAPVVGGASRAVGPEFAQLRSNVSLLRHIAEATGGRLLSLEAPLSAELFNRDGLQPSRASSPLWRILLAWAFFVFLLDVATRRIAWDRFLTRSLLTDMREQAMDRVRLRSEQAAATLAALRKRDEAGPEAPDAHAAPPPNAVQQQRPSAPQIERRTQRTPEENEAEQRRRQQEAERAARQKELRSAMLRRLAKEPEKDPSSDKGKSDGEGKKDKDVADTTSGLLAAKKRARERYSQGDDA